MADSLIGGDLAGLHHMGSTLQKAPEEMRGVVTALSSGVDALVGAAGWNGAAADNFHRAWSSDSVTAGALSAVVSGVGGTIDTLATALDQLNTKLGDAAATAEAAGVHVGADGSVKPFLAPLPAGASSSPTVEAANIYSSVSALLVQEARKVRLTAETELSGLLDQLLGTKPASTPDLYVTSADYLRGLLAYPNAGSRDLIANYAVRREALQTARKQARVQLTAAQHEAALAGEKLPRTDPANVAFRRTIEDIKSIDQDVSAAPAGKGLPALSEALDVRPGDLAGAARLAEAARLPKFLAFTKEIPVIDIAATAAAAGLQTKDDMEKGWSARHAIGADFGAGAIGLGVGIGTGGLAIGVGDLDYQAFHEHWSEDIHKDGVVGGVLDGIGHSGARVGSDAKHVAEDIGHGASSLGHKVWHGLFG